MGIEIENNKLIIDNNIYHYVFADENKDTYYISSEKNKSLTLSVLRNIEIFDDLKEIKIIDLGVLQLETNIIIDIFKNLSFLQD
jgi:choline kinase